MDQIKPVIDILKKYHFWILMLLILAGSVTIFWMSKSQLVQEIEAEKSKINQDYNTVSLLGSQVSTHPNSFSQKAMDEIINKHKFDVQQAWSLQYEKQKQYLKWPTGVTSQEAIDKLDKMRPIETSVPNPMTDTEDPLSPTYRAQYKDYISKVFPGIAGIIGANWSAVDSPTATATKNPNPLVIWEATSQKTLLESIAPWSTRTPSTLEILYTQEDLWILAGLMNIIKTVNSDARENFQAPIKEIKWIRIGRAANGAAGEAEFVSGTAAASASAYGGGGDAGSYGGSSPYGAGAAGGAAGGGGGASPYGGAGGGYGASQAVVAVDPAANRYVDENYKPVSTQDLISRIKSPEPKDAFYAVAKRVPVQMRLNMDQRRVAELIAACGNNDLMVEIKQVRIGTEESSEGASAAASAGGGAGGGYGGAGGGYGGAGGGYGAEGGAKDSGGYGGAGGGYGGAGGGYGGAGDGYGGGGGGMGSDVTWIEKGYELEVEIYGIILLFNPVDIDRLGIEKVQASTDLDGSSEVKTPEPEVPAVQTPADLAPAAAPTPVVPATPAQPDPAQPTPAQPDPNQPNPVPPANPPVPSNTNSAAITRPGENPL